MNIKSYNWEELYKKANDFIAEYIPVAKVNTGRKSLFWGCPRVEISFPEKGNRQYIELLDEMKCLRKLRGFKSVNGRIIMAEIIFDTDGTLSISGRSEQDDSEPYREE